MFPSEPACPFLHLKKLLKKQLFREYLLSYHFLINILLLAFTLDTLTSLFALLFIIWKCWMTKCKSQYFVKVFSFNLILCVLFWLRKPAFWLPNLNGCYHTASMSRCWSSFERTADPLEQNNRPGTDRKWRWLVLPNFIGFIKFRWDQMRHLRRKDWSVFLCSLT